MMKALEKLVASQKVATVGNHTVVKINKESYYYRTGKGKQVNSWGVVINEGKEECARGFNRAFLYHGNTICLVDDEKRRVILTHAGWDTPSTSRAINDYRRYFIDERGYTLVDED